MRIKVYEAVSRICNNAANEDVHLNVCKRGVLPLSSQASNLRTSYRIREAFDFCVHLQYIKAVVKWVIQDSSAAPTRLSIQLEWCQRISESSHLAEDSSLGYIGSSLKVVYVVKLYLSRIVSDSTIFQEIELWSEQSKPIERTDCIWNSVLTRTAATCEHSHGTA